MACLSISLHHNANQPIDHMPRTSPSLASSLHQLVILSTCWSTILPSQLLCYLVAAMICSSTLHLVAIAIINYAILVQIPTTNNIASYADKDSILQMVNVCPHAHLVHSHTATQISASNVSQPARTVMVYSKHNA